MTRHHAVSPRCVPPHRAERVAVYTHGANNLWITTGASLPTSCGQQVAIHNSEQLPVVTLSSLWEAGDRSRTSPLALTCAFGMLSPIHSPTTPTREYSPHEDRS